MTKVIQSIRGMNDILPNQIEIWHHLETTLIQLAQGYGYREIRMPLLESASLFKRSVGTDTDIVQKEMYQFEDQNGDSLALRPEGSAPCVRACIQHSLIYNQTQRLWYLGPMYRRERPQKGRYRQFYQFGIEAYGFSGSTIEVEQILLISSLWKQLNLQDITLELNHLGSKESRNQYIKELVNYLNQHLNQLDPDSQNRLKTNPLRILDSKAESTQQILNDAPSLTDFISEKERNELNETTTILDTLGIAYVINPRLVRGLDYYNGLVFEYTTTQLGAQGTICAGGRYDTLIEQLGGQPTAAFGLAMGLERIIELMQLNKTVQTTAKSRKLHLLCPDQAALAQSFQVIQKLKTQCPDLTTIIDSQNFKLKNQLKRANKANCDFVIILGEDELNGDFLNFKFMQEDHPQQQLKLEDIIKQINSYSPQTKEVTS